MTIAELERDRLVGTFGTGQIVVRVQFKVAEEAAGFAKHFRGHVL
jgi:hypothetical protein